ncbi:unnamed protein product [Ostreobium quekettii]|uniref:Uncharacterized protein n=1 Tax=Ostreobium quekettii TaxID=121088 RepID=A0A8S1JEQ6_9CHLO|nr:unnamed protein product [Ostreobium quekettii]
MRLHQLDDAGHCSRASALLPDDPFPQFAEQRRKVCQQLLQQTTGSLCKQLSLLWGLHAMTVLLQFCDVWGCDRNRVKEFLCPQAFQPLVSCHCSWCPEGNMMMYPCPFFNCTEQGTPPQQYLLGDFPRISISSFASYLGHKSCSNISFRECGFGVVLFCLICLLDLCVLCLSLVPGVVRNHLFHIGRLRPLHLVHRDKTKASLWLLGMQSAAMGKHQQMVILLFATARALPGLKVTA